MSFFTSLLVAVFCMSVVFLVLAILFALIRIFTAVLRLLSDKRSVKDSGADSKDIQHTAAVVSQPSPAAATVADGAAVPAQPAKKAVTGEIKLNNVDEKTAAMLMAIVSHESGIPLANLIFKSVRLLDEETPAAV